MSISTIGSGAALRTEAQAEAQLGVASGTSILTLDGEIPVEYLSPGDRIITRSGTRRLHSIEVTRLENARIVRISRDVLGHDRPAADLVLRPDQPILIRDWRAMALYGTAAALVPARRLADGEYIRAEVLPDLRAFSLCFADEAVIYANGIELSCAPAKVTA